MAQVAQHDLGGVVVVEKHAFGDLDLDLGRRRMRFIEQVANGLEEVGVAHLRRRHVDRHLQARPAMGVLHGAAHDQSP